MKQIRGRLSYANVMATVAVFMASGCRLCGGRDSQAQRWRQAD